MMRVLLLGAHGQLGRELAKVIPPDALRWGRDEFDFHRVDDLRGRIEQVRPAILINAVGMTNVDRCETARDEARAVNMSAPSAIARACKDVGCLMVHISTDYVFGSDASRDKPYVESDITGAVNYYGMTKLGAEQGVIGSGCPHLILRVCGLYGGITRQPGFVERIIAQGKSGTTIRLQFDQIYSPTYVAELAPAIWRLAQDGVRGIVHLVDRGAVRRSEFTRTILHELRLHSDVIVEDHSYQGVPRPLYSALDSERLSLKEYMNDWHTSLQHYLTTL